MSGTGHSTKFVASTGDQAVDGVLSSIGWNAATIYYSFPTANGEYTYGTERNTFGTVSSLQQTATHFALNADDGNAANDGFSLEGFTSLAVVLTSAANAHIRLAESSAPPTAWAYYPSTDSWGGDVWFGRAYDYRSPTPGTYAWHTVLHEIGHALGLKHGQETDVYGAVPYAMDSMEYTVMTYRSYIGDSNTGYNNGYWDYAQTYMMLDIAALQEIYGADFSTNSGATVYSWVPWSADTWVNGVRAIDTNGAKIFATVWDGGGNDTYDLSAYGSALVVDLRPGQHSSFASEQVAYLGDGHYARGNIFNALQYDGDPRSLIENAIGGSGADTITGNSADNRLEGQAGSDGLVGLSGNDSLAGGSGNDTALFGGQGVDTLNGGSSNDSSLFGGDGVDTLVGGPGDDRALFGGEAADTIFGSQGDDGSLWGGGADDRVFGRVGSDVSLFGESGSDRIYGDDGDDGALFGGSGADWVYGGSGSDSAVMGNAGNDSLEGGVGPDWLYGDTGSDALRGQSGDDFMFGGFGIDSLLGAGGDDAGYGGSGNDRLGGGTGSDSLFGGDDSDFLNGGSGVDTAEGGLVNDTYLVDRAGDVVRESSGGGGADLVRSAATDFTLADGTDGFIERGNINKFVGDADLTGNALDNTLLGSSGRNSLFGGSGADTLNGRSGRDALFGGSGDDTFVVDTVGDRPFELDGEGTDLVRARVSFTLPSGTAGASLENLRLEGADSDLNATGNNLHNEVTGNAGNNRLAGNQGNDTLQGRDGDDTIFGGGQADRMLGESGADTLMVGKDDQVFGGADADWFQFDTYLTAGIQEVRDFDGASLGAANGEDHLVFGTGLEVGSFAYVGNSAFTRGGMSEARFAGSDRVQVDVDGNGSTDILFRISGLSVGNLLTVTDFVWL